MYSYTPCPRRMKKQSGPPKNALRNLRKTFLGGPPLIFGFYFSLVSGCFFIFSLATESISLMRLSWLTSLAPGS